MENVNYKTQQHQQMAASVRQAVNELTLAFKDRNYLFLSQAEEKLAPARYLAKYLADTYPNFFNLLVINYDKDILESAEYFGNLDQAPIQAKEVWQYVLTKIKPQLHDLVWVRLTNQIRLNNKRLGNYLYFVNDDGVYVAVNNCGNSYAPDEFLSFMRRMGLLNDMQDFIYKGPWLQYRSDKWPNSNLLNKLN